MATRKETLETVLRELKELKGADIENVHNKADNLLLVALLVNEDTLLQDIAHAYSTARAEIGFWYS